VHYTLHSGYDKHAVQQFTHANLLSEFTHALKAFLNDLRAARLKDRVVVLAFSEFNRRVDENASEDTDHGTAGLVFVAGAVKGGLVGEAPSLDDLDKGDLRRQFNFCQVYATLLDGWLDVPSSDILGESFDRLSII
jgi:uncharacterized protein (DUF1501 family)